MRTLIKDDTHIGFMAKGPLALKISAGAMIGSVLLLLVMGLNFGLDFTGGTVVEVGYPQAADVNAIRHQLQAQGLTGEVQFFGSSKDVLIRLAPNGEVTSAQLSTEVLRALQQADAEVTLRRVEYVGPKVGSELVENGGMALLFALMGILAYVTFRFEWRLAVGTIAAIIHDVTITLGFFALFQVEIDLTVLAALLAVIGYSVNDSVVVLDRIRENFRKMRKRSVETIMDLAINQMLSRTLMTSLTTLLAVIVLYVFGGPMISHFAFALIVGVVVGTYSSIYVAGNVALRLGLSRDDLLPVEKIKDKEVL